MSTKVRLRPEKVPGHNVSEQGKKLLGKFILVGEPIRPKEKHWICGTDLIWPVLDEKALEIMGLDEAFVCRHQIEAGD